PASSSTTKESDAEGEAVSALISLSYKPPEASRMISKIAKPGLDCETLIRDALRAAL
ncbi:MAG: Holliday junction branch migration protein RuvA, partial [Ewingella sp.]|nr:Holliday junction branch migration protein RuvA [Ewingella sp.]